MDRDVYIGRILRYADPQAYIKFKQLSTPMLNHKHVDKVTTIHQITTELYGSSEDNRTLADIFIAATYQIYCPVSFIPSFKEDGKDAQAVGKLPPGVRDKMAEILGLKHAEEINRYKGYISSWLRPFYTGPARSFESKVKAVVERMKPYSLNSWDYQHQLAF